MKLVYILPSEFDPISWNQWQPSKNTTWKRTFSVDDSDIIIGIDSLNFNWNLKQKKILLLAEPIGILPYNYKIFENEHFLNNLDLIGTHHLRFIGKHNIIEVNPPVGTSIVDKQIYPKTKLCSIVTSLKNYAPGHLLRHKILTDSSYTTLDRYGRPFNPVEDKTDGLRDYAFSFAIENCTERGYYTEKLLDCFLTGTIPIYWGDPGIDHVFDKNGILFYDDKFDYKHLSFDLYYSKMKSIENNFYKAVDILKTNNMDYCLTTLITKVIR
jgi:hypothetical protein